MNKYKFTFLKIDGEWMEEDDVIEEYGFSGLEKAEDSFSIEVEANSWKDAKEKIKIAAKVI